MLENLKTYKKWLDENGFIYPMIDFDVRPFYGPFLKCENSIAQNTCLISIPRKLLIDREIVKASPIQSIFEENTFLTEDEESHSQLILTLFLIWEKNKGAKSFYFPFLELYSKRTSFSDWNADEINTLCSNDLKRQVYSFTVSGNFILNLRQIFRYQLDLEDKWNEICFIFEKCKKIFPDAIEKYKKDFFWGYELILHRSVKISDRLVFAPLLDMIPYAKRGNIKLQVLFFAKP